MKFHIKYFFSKCDQIPCFWRIWSRLLKKFSKGPSLIRMDLEKYYIDKPIARYNWKAVTTTITAPKMEQTKQTFWDVVV